jgi:anti-sigma regulatory factor (Ser/Thr protein kinase)
LHSGAQFSTKKKEGTGLRTTPELHVGDDDTALHPDKADGGAYRFPLPPHPIAAEQARLLTKIALDEWKINDIADNALIVVAELVTNAMKLGDVFQLALSRRGDALLIEVRDSSEACPDPRRQAADRVDGRGLLLVEACADTWGWRLEDEGGKTVWAVVQDPGARTAPAASDLRM